MNDLDMSRGSHELFPETTPQYDNVYTDPSVGDPLDMGVTQPVAAEQAKPSDKEMNFRALREETSKLKEEASYWKGQAEAYSKQPSRMPEPTEAGPEFDKLDWDDSRDVRKAWEAMHKDNQRLREEMRDSLAAANTKAQHQDWNSMVTQHVPSLTQQNPMFAEMIQKASNPYEAAYLLAQLNSKASQPQVPQNTNGQRAMENARKPQTLASVGGQGQISQADYYANMSDADFHKIAARNMENI